MIGIYKITAPDGKVYIGQSRNIEKRLRSHASGSHKLINGIYESTIYSFKYGSA
jgi:predicted GIY-YIG superfamily endonuclease